MTHSQKETEQTNSVEIVPTDLFHLLVGPLLWVFVFMVIKFAPELESLVGTRTFWEANTYSLKANFFLSTLFAFAGYALIPKCLPGDSYAPYYIFQALFICAVKSVIVLISLNFLFILLLPIFISLFFLVAMISGIHTIIGFFSLIAICCVGSSLLYSYLYFCPRRDLFWQKRKAPSDNKDTTKSSIDYVKRY